MPPNKSKSMILTGRDGLKEVAEKDGRWNWVLVGPNPETLPLVGGGQGSVKEMRECLKKQEAEQQAEQQFANFYGLIRVGFGVGRMARKKYVFVQASRQDEREEAEGEDGTFSPAARGVGVSAVKHGQALAQRGAMEKALLEFVHFAAKIEVTRLEDLSVSNVVEKVQKGSTADADLLTIDSYLEAQEEWYSQQPQAANAVPEQAAKSDDKTLTQACVAEVFLEECAPQSEVVEKESEMELVDESNDNVAPFPISATIPEQPAEKKPEEPERPRIAPPRRYSADERMAKELQEEEDRKAAVALAASQPEAPKAEAKPAEPAAASKAPATALYQRGDLLFVYSNAAKQWMDDGIVVGVLDTPGEHDGLKLPKDSIKVQYNSRRQFKWVTPSQTHQYLRKSNRPVPPPTLLGELLKETHNWITQWHVRYFELSKGYLQWWMTADDARAGVVPNGSLSLTGLEMTVQGTVMYIRTERSKGMIYAFDATTFDSVGKWSSMMKQHEEYCQKMQMYLTQQAKETEQAQSQEKLQGMVQARKRRASLNVNDPDAANTTAGIASAIRGAQ